MRHAAPKHLLILIALLAARPATAGEHRILFVGNSYTYANGDTGVAGVYGALAEEGVGAWDVIAHETVAKGGWTFHKHAQDVETPGQELYDLLGAGDKTWDVVVFQEQSQIPGFHPYNAPDWNQSIAAAPTLDLYAAAAGAETFFLMTWGRREGDPMNASIFPDYPTMQGLLTKGYGLYASAVSTPERQAWVAPAGLAWQAVWDMAKEAGQDPLDPEHLFSRLYTGDGSHPSQLGSYLMGLVVYASITGRDPSNLSWGLDGITAGEEAQLQAATRVAVLAPPFETVDYGWGPLFKAPWLHSWEEAARTDGEGLVTLSDPIRLRTTVVTGPASASTIILGGADGAGGRIVLQDEAALTVSEVLLGPGGVGALAVAAGTLTATTVEVPVTLTGGGWVIPATGQATMEGTLLLGADAALRFDLEGPPEGGALDAALAITGAASLAGRIYVVPSDDLTLTEPTSWTLLDATTITPLPELELDAPEGATMEIVDGGAGEVLRVTLPANATPTLEPSPDVVVGEDVEAPDTAQELGPESGHDTPGHETPGHETPSAPETVGPDAEQRPGGDSSGGCGIGTTGSAWWSALLVGLGVAPCRRRRLSPTGDIYRERPRTTR